MRHAIQWLTRTLFVTLFAAVGWTIVPAHPVQGQAIAALQLALDSADPASLVVGQPVRVSVQGEVTASAASRYRLRVAPVGEPLRIVRDFQPENLAVWTPYEEGEYMLESTVLDSATDTIVTIQQVVSVRSRVPAGGKPVITATDHPLVFLYSAPPCYSGQIRVEFTQFFTTNRSSTHWRPCSAKSTNFYLAGLLPNTGYVVQDTWVDGSNSRLGPRLTMRSGTIDVTVPTFSVRDAPDRASSRVDGVVLHSISGLANDAYFPVATDLSGRPIWYHRFAEDSQANSLYGVEYLVQALAAQAETLGANFLALINQGDAIGQFVREIDLAGNTVFETNIEQVNRQLVARGEDPVVCFNHEAVRLPNGHTLVLAYVLGDLSPELYAWQTQAVGEMIIALDQEAQVIWTWNPFDHLDIERPAVLDERWLAAAVCNTTPIARTAPDWTHANAIDYSPADGSLLLSMRHQDWVIKIDYADGAGSGEVLWRLGREGDFTLVADPSIAEPWFSHQHDARWDPDAAAGDTIILFDNGNTRCQGIAWNCNSRGQVWQIDEATREATLLVNVDLGVYSSRFGSAQRLSNGNYHFLAGIVQPGTISQSIEVGPARWHPITYILEADYLAYRTWRMPDLYSLPSPMAAMSAGGEFGDLFLPLIQR